MKKRTRALTAGLILTTTLLCTLSPQGWAMLAPASGASEAERSGRAADMKTIQTALESKVIRARLKSMGLSDAEIDSRLRSLSDQQVHRLAKDVDTLGAGGDLGGLLLIVLLVVLIVYLIHRM